MGLSLAYQLAQQGLRLIVLDRRASGREASWAGAGILPPANPQTAVHPYDQLRALSFRLHEQWANELLSETGIDNGYRRCGGIYLARTPGEAAALAGLVDLMGEEGIQVESAREKLADLEPSLLPTVQNVRAAWWVPDECQLRNPWHLKALQSACIKLGVKIVEHCPVRSFRILNGRIDNLQTDDQTITADKFCITTGAWTASLLSPLGIEIAILPIRGQMVLFQARPGYLRHIINDGPRYLVPRDDGRILAGSTEEEVGFDRSTTTQAIEELIEFAGNNLHELSAQRVEHSWAGLRPGTFDGLPYLGQIPDIFNGFVAAGHFRSGLYLSTGTAVIMSRLITGSSLDFDLSPFRLQRG